MPNLGKLWAGRVYGTNLGNLFIELTDTGPKINGSFRFLDSTYGVCVYSITGEFGEKLTFKGTPLKSREGVELGEIEAEARLTPEGNLKGQWRSSLGTGGTFEAYPHDVNSPTAPIPASASTHPEQLFTRVIEIGAIRLFPDDVRNLLRYIKEDFDSGRVVVTYKIRGSQVSRYADQFTAEMTTLPDLDYLKINVQEPEAHGLNRVATVELNPFGSSTVQVQGIRESWVVGKAEGLSRMLRTYQSSFVTTFRRYGLTAQTIFVFAMMIVMPGLDSWKDRAIFASSVLFVVGGFVALHTRFIPNTLVYLGSSRPSILSRAWPTMVSWVGAIGTGLIGKLLYDWLANSPKP